MSKTFTVVLGEQTYTLHPFNIDELEQVADFLGTVSPNKLAFSVVRIALRRADPSVPKGGEIEATLLQVADAARMIMKESGLAEQEATAATGEPLPAG